MFLIKSISGVRGTIHKDDNKGLSSFEIEKCINQYSLWLKQYENLKVKKGLIVLGRDGRVSGDNILSQISDILIKLKFNVLNLSLTTTPSVQMAIITEKCIGGIMVSASHNPINWNGLKFLNSEGEFLSKKQSEQFYNIQINSQKKNESILNYGTINYFDYKEKHTSLILNLPDVDVDSIKGKKFKIVVDGINSSGGVFVPFLLEKLGVEVIKLNCVPNGNFSHNPEPLPNNLTELSDLVISTGADLGIAVDPDVDRLVFICEDGSFFGEEYTIVAIAKYILSNRIGNTVCNLSSSNALKDITLSYGGKHFYSPVGEANVIQVMKENNAIFGGEGSGGVIFPELHYGRDALVGIALFLSLISRSNLKITDLKNVLPKYFMLKEKIKIADDFSFDKFLLKYKKYFQEKDVILIDGLRINLDCGSWIHIRKSNTEPIIRIISESNSKDKVIELMEGMIVKLKNLK